MKAAVYLRVSTDDQNLDPQRIEMAEYCSRRGWEPEFFEDKASGSKASREGLDRMMAAVRRGKIGVVVAVKLDRLGRSVQHLAQMAGELIALNVGLCVPGQGIDTSGGQSNPAAMLQLNILAAVAQFEREIIRERTRAGLRAAVARGSTLGRPTKLLSDDDLELIRGFEPGQAGGLKALAVKIGCSVGKAHALVKAQRADS